MISRWLLVLLCSHFFVTIVNANNSDQVVSFEEVLFSISDPASIQGSFNGDLQVAVSEEGYCLAGSLNNDGIFETSVELLVPTSFFNLQLYGRGDYQLEIYDQHYGWVEHEIYGNEKSFSWQKISWEASGKIGYFRYRVRLSDNDSLFCKLSGPRTIRLNSNWPMTTSSKPFRSTTGNWSGIIGVNLEADYLFLELDREQRKLLLQQAKSDGFCSIRLHKLTRLMQSLKFNRYFDLTLQNFFDDLYEIGLSLSIDILSWPLKTELKTGQVVENGWKQLIYLSPELQERSIKIIDWLGNYWIGKSPFFQSDNLVGVCLFNENSLYAEAPSDMFLNFDDPCKIMLEVGSFYRNYLRQKGYSGSVFLTNYQLSGGDQSCNLRFSKSIDRHLYFDYPKFSEGRLKVSGRSPLEFLVHWKKRYLNLFSGASECWISEINLPWPNQFTHELLPTILVLHNQKKLSGLWFYDYRLRSSDFHRGGPFGIQRFRSVIEPLGWFKSLMNEDLVIEYHNNRLDIYSDQGAVRCILRGHPTERTPHCQWIRGTHRLITGPEMALGDQFEPQFLLQKQFGRQAMYLDI